MHSQTTVSTSPQRTRILAGAYELVKHVASGGMGAIFQARRLSDGRLVAVKTLHQQLMKSREAVQRFKREFEAIARLEHPDIIKVFDHGVDPSGRLYLVMEWLEGLDLQHLLEEGEPLPPVQAAWIALKVARCLSHAHNTKIIHRDLKPENIFLIKGDKPGEMRVKILDFGLAKILDDQMLSNITFMGEVCGTPAFMSPEQASGYKIDGRSDLYALGCVLFNMLTGLPPFTADNPLVLMRKHQTDPLPELPDSIPIELKQILWRATEKKPEDRFPDATMMAGALKAFICAQEGPSWVHETLPPRVSGNADTAPQVANLSAETDPQVIGPKSVPFIRNAPKHKDLRNAGRPLKTLVKEPAAAEPMRFSAPLGLDRPPAPGANSLRAAQGEPPKNLQTRPALHQQSLSPQEQKNLETNPAIPNSSQAEVEQWKRSKGPLEGMSQAEQETHQKPSVRQARDLPKLELNNSKRTVPLRRSASARRASSMRRSGSHQRTHHANRRDSESSPQLVGISPSLSKLLPTPPQPFTELSWDTGPSPSPFEEEQLFSPRNIGMFAALIFVLILIGFVLS